MISELNPLINTSLEDILFTVPEIEVKNVAALAAEQKLIRLNVPQVYPPEDTDSPKYPKDLASVDSATLGQTYGKFMAWTGYCRYLINLKEADILLVRNVISRARKVLKRDLHDHCRKNNLKMTVEEKRDFVDCHSIIISTDKLLVDYEIQKKVVEGRFYHFDNCSKAISREISRRELDNRL